MYHGIVAELAGKSAEHGPTFLGEDFVGWRTALVVAIPAAMLYEVAMALTRKMTLRLPFLILKFARLGMPKAEWEYQGQEWKAELWSILENRDRHWFLRFIDGMTFAIPLAAGGGFLAAKASVKAGLQNRSARRPKRGRHAAPTSAVEIAMRAGVAGGMALMVAVAGAYLMWFAMGAGAMAAFITLILVIRSSYRQHKMNRLLFKRPAEGRVILASPPGSARPRYRGLIAHRLLDVPANERRRIPVGVQMRDWNPDVTSCEDYVISTLKKYLGLRPTLSRRLIEGGRVFPIFDGFDELPSERRAAAIDELNRQWVGRPLFITCRQNEARHLSGLEGADGFTYLPAPARSVAPCCGKR